MKKIILTFLMFASFLFGSVNINTATVDKLKSLKGIGDAKAKAIVEYRKDQNFTSIEDIKKVKGIGSKIFDGIKNDITVK